MNLSCCGTATDEMSLTVVSSVNRHCPGVVMDDHWGVVDDHKKTPHNHVAENEPIGAFSQHHHHQACSAEHEPVGEFFSQGFILTDDPEGVSGDPVGVSSDEEDDDVGSFLGDSETEDELEDELFIAGWSFEAPPVSTRPRSATTYLRTTPHSPRVVTYHRQRSASAPEWSPGSDLARALPDTCAHCEAALDRRSDVFIALDKVFCSA